MRGMRVDDALEVIANGYGGPDDSGFVYRAFGAMEALAAALAAAQEEGRVLLRALEMACEAIEEHVRDLAVPADAGFYIAQARADAKEGGEG